MKNIALDSFTHIIKKKPWLMLLIIIAGIGVVISSVAPAHMLKNIIDNYIIPLKFEGILYVAFIYFFLLFLSSFFDFFKSLTLVLFGQRLCQYIQENLSDKLIRLKSQYYASKNAGETASLFINDVDTVNYVFTTGIMGIAIDCFKVIAILFSIYMFSPSVMIIVCMFLPVIIIITRIIQKMMFAAQIQNRLITGNLNNAISETKEVLNMIKLNGKENFMTNRWNKILKDNYIAAEKVNFADSISSPIPQVLKAIAIGIVVYMTSNGSVLTVGMLAASIELISNLFDPIEAISNELQSVQKAFSGIKKLNEFYNEDEQNHSLSNINTNFVTTPMTVEFKHVCFQYVEDRPIIQDVSFFADSEDTLAIAGRTGVGKTTIFNLITGLYEPTNGSVNINGIQAHSIPSEFRRPIFAYVSQSFMPIIGTIMDQISLMDERITNEMVYDAMKIVGLHDEIILLKNGYNTVFKKGILSEGQEQLLNIARAIVMKPKILLLDEMSARLDSMNESRIQESLDIISKDKTTISISHRISSILYSEKIICLKDGRIERILNLADNDVSILDWNL